MSKAGGKCWRWKYTFEGKEKRLSLGAWPEVSLEDVLKQCDAFRKLLKEGIDPGTQKGQPRAVGSGEDRVVMFKDVAVEFVENQRNIRAASHTVTVEGRFKLDIQRPTKANDKKILNKLSMRIQWTTLP